MDWSPRLGNTGPEKATNGSPIQEFDEKKATKTRQYDLLRPRLGQQKPPKVGSTICYGQMWTRKSHQVSAVPLVTAKSWPDKTTKTRHHDKHGPENATKTQQYDLLRPRVVQKKPPRLGSTIWCGQTWARKSHQDSAVNVGQKKPPRLGNTICWRPDFGLKKSPRLGNTI